MTVLSPDQVQGIVVDPPAQPVEAPAPINPADVRVDHVATTQGDAAKSIGMGLARGAAESPGWIGDLSALLRAGYTKLSGAAPDVVGSKLFGPKAPVTSRDLATLIDQTGVKYDPTGDTAKKLYDVAHFAGGTVGQGMLSAGPKLFEGGVKELAKQGAKDAITGTGAGAGVEAARYGADKADISEENHPYQRAALEFGGALLGGGATGIGMNHLTSRLDNPADRPALMKDYDAAGVEPRFPGDVGQKSAVFNDFLPNRLGARAYSANSAGKTQSELSDYAKRVLNPNPEDLTGAAGLGEDIGDLAASYTKRLRGQGADPAQISELEQYIKQSPENAPGWTLAEAPKGGSRIDWLLGGGTSADQTAPEAKMADSIGRRLLLHAGSDSNGEFNLDKFNQFWSSLPGDTRNALTRYGISPEGQALDDGVERISRLYDATAGSRDLAKGAADGSTFDPLHSTGAGFVGGYLLSGHDLGTAGMAAAGLGMAQPAIARGLAGYAQRGSFTGRGTNLGAEMSHVAQEGTSLFPDQYHPAPAPAPVQRPAPGVDIHSWLQGVDKPTAVSYVSERLGPQAGAQLESADGEGYRAAMSNLSALPEMRAALAPGDA